MSRLSLLLSLLLATGRLAQRQTCAHTRPTHDRQAPSSRQRTVTSLPRPLTAVEGKLVLADNRFTLKLFRQVASSTRIDHNLVASPFSVATALAMAYNGAAGRTHDEMQRALSLEGMTLQDVNDAYRALAHVLRGLDPQVCFQLANSAWYRPIFAPTSSFLDATRAYFGAQVRSIDFDAASAAPTINAW